MRQQVIMEPAVDQVDVYRKERRGTTRYLFSAPVLIFRTEANPPDTYGITLELSDCGLSALVNDALEPGETVYVRLRLSMGSLQAKAVVRHHTGRHYGFDFVDLRPAELDLVRSTTRTMQVYCGRWLTS
jgi:hypothetical protein